ncbi:MAG: F0F1 ATP synthase subunit A [Alphaproteobacteria bacterium]|nr:F0F1 ATP synthase subunit A [Alphaproteobacteria bacterium]
MAEAGGGHSPLEQFQIKEIIPLKLGGVDVSFTNSALAMTAAVVLVSCFLIFSMRRGALVPGRWQVVAELSYEFIANMIRDNVGQEGRRYFPFIFALFMFIFAGNLIGMIPYSFTYTSHLAVTFGMAAVVFIGVTIIGIVKHGVKFLGFFLPHGVPWFLAWLIIPIEILSYLSRPVSLSLRLFANMTAGHTMMKVFAGFIFVLGAAGLAPLAMVVALTGLEIIIAFLQAYVFAILTCVYLNDAIHLH